MRGETERLRLRLPETGDLEGMVALWTDPQTTAHTGGPRDRDAVLEFFQDYVSDPEAMARDEGEHWWSIVERASGQWIGLCSLIEQAEDGRVEAELGYFLLPAYWGQGFALEAAGRVMEHAFEAFGLESVVAIVDRDNAASAAVASGLGMVLEGEALRSDGVTRCVYRLRRGGSEGQQGRSG